MSRRVKSMHEAAWFAWVACLLFFPGFAAKAGEVDLRTELREIVLAEDDPDMEKQLAAFAEQRRIPVERVVELLGQLVTEGLRTRDRMARYACNNSVSLLGHLGHSSAVPTLVQASRSRYDNIRRTAISSYVEVRGADSVEFAREVIDNRRRFKDHDRFILYEQLSRYAASEAGLDPDAFQGYIMFGWPKPGGAPKEEPLKKKDAAVTQLLAKAIRKERDPDGAKDLDKILSGVSRLYKTSIQRERVLRRFARSWSGRVRRYFSRELKKLLQVPKEKRTDLDRIRLQEEGAQTPKERP